jgi:nitrite reductase (NADH) large subunit
VGSDVGSELRRRGLAVEIELSPPSLAQPRTRELARWLGLVESSDSRAAADSVRWRRGERRTLLVVGNGMVSHHLCERLMAYDTERRYRVTVLGEERHAAYDRTSLRRAFDVLDAEQLALARGRWYEDNAIRLLLNERAVKLQRDERVVVAASGRRIAFDVCVIATGSQPYRTPLPGADKRGVHGYRTFDDVAAIAAHARSARRAAVVAVGPFSLDAVQAALDLGLETHVVRAGPTWGVEPILDRGATRMLERRLAALGAHVHAGRVPVAILGQDAVSGLAFSDGDRLEIDLLILCNATHPRDELARQARLSTSECGGIVVDDGMATSDPAVYAVGECVAHRDRTHSMLGPCQEMADVLAHNLTHETRRSFIGSDRVARARVLDLEYASFGDPLADSRTGHALLYENPERNVYKKLVLSEDGQRLVGGLLLGDTRSFSGLIAQYRSGGALPSSPERLLDDTEPFVVGASSG